MQRIAEVCEPVFRERGFKKVNVADLCKVAGVSRRAFYELFDDKETLAAIVVSHRMRERKSRLEAEIRAERPFHEKVRMILEQERVEMARLGPTFLREIEFAEGPLAELLEHGCRDSQRLIEEFLINEQRRGEIRDDLTRDEVAYLLGLADKMMDDPELMALRPEISDRMVFAFEFIMNGLCRRP